MKHQTTTKKTAGKRSVGQEVIASLKEAIAWAGGENVPVRITTVPVPMIDLRAVRRRLGLSQSEFAARFGFQPGTLKNWEQGRTRPDGPARVLLAVIARHPEAVEDALRKGRMAVF
jgi:putative transcriptional regulator